MKARLFLYLLIFILLYSCKPVGERNSSYTENPKGKLYIIGGGKRPQAMVNEIIGLSGVDKSGYIVILPMSSSEPDTSFFYAKKQFTDQGIEKIYNYNFQKDSTINKDWIDSLRNANLIYIAGGEQTKFMAVVLNTEIQDAIKNAYYKGAVVAGTSAGAAVMSKKMITGNEFKYPEYTGDFRTIEANNMEIAEGLGMLENTIVDQHFIKRMRMNRLISVSLENPGYYCAGIDESTALVVTPDSVYVGGVSQIIVLFNEKVAYVNEKELMGGQNIRLDVYLPGERIDLPIH